MLSARICVSAASSTAYMYMCMGRVCIYVCTHLRVYRYKRVLVYMDSALGEGFNNLTRSRRVAQGELGRRKWLLILLPFILMYCQAEEVLYAPTTYLQHSQTAKAMPCVTRPPINVQLHGPEWAPALPVLRAVSLWPVQNVGGLIATVVEGVPKNVGHALFSSRFP